MQDNIRYEIRRRKSVLTPMYLEMMAMMVEQEIAATLCKRGPKDSIGEMYTEVLTEILRRIQKDIDLYPESH